jgi:Leucine-rich repeat (LRR) protein
LEKLVLFGNRITGWGNGFEIFGNMTSLKILDLSTNQRSSISKAGEVENSLLIADAFIFSK